ncbi:hypothetical protein NKDENANG_03369 [Candidatus Entotheonellaceae bacterium PAL068K]
MVNLTDPNQVRLTGENSYMRLHLEENGPMVTRGSHWRVLLSPGGPGHALFLRSDVTNDEVRIYADNIAVARWLQQEIFTSGEFSNQDIPVRHAVFSKSGDSRFFWTENIENEAEKLSLTWYDFGEPFVISVPVGSVPERPMGWSSVFVPARGTRLTRNGKATSGRPFPELRGDRTSSTAGLALSETWLHPS